MRRRIYKKKKCQKKCCFHFRYCFLTISENIGRRTFQLGIFYFFPDWTWRRRRQPTLWYLVLIQCDISPVSSRASLIRGEIRNGIGLELIRKAIVKVFDSAVNFRRLPHLICPRFATDLYNVYNCFFLIFVCRGKL